MRSHFDGSGRRAGGKKTQALSPHYYKIKDKKSMSKSTAARHFTSQVKVTDGKLMWLSVNFKFSSPSLSSLGTTWTSIVHQLCFIPLIMSDLYSQATKSQSLEWMARSNLDTIINSHSQSHGDSYISEGTMAWLKFSHISLACFTPGLQHRFSTKC